MDVLLWLALFALALYAVALGNLVLRVHGMVLRRPLHRVCRADEVPAWLVSFAAPAVERLTALGFRPLGALASVALDRQAEAETIDLVFHAPGAGTYAFVYVPPTVPGVRPLCVDLATWGADGCLRLTLALGPGPTHREAAGTYVVAYPELSLGRRFARHAFDNAGVEALTLGLEAVAADLTERNRATLRAAEAAGDVSSRDDGTLGHTLLGTTRLVVRILLGLLRPEAGTSAFHGAYGPDRVGEPAPPEQQALAHEELLCLSGRRRRRGRAVLLFVGSLALFVLSIGDRMHGVVLPALGVALLFHEFGQFAAMRAFGDGAVLLRATSAFIFVLAGVALDVALLTVIGFVVATGLPGSVRVARVAARWTRPEPPADRVALYALVDGSGYAALRFGRKLALVQALAHRFDTPPPSPGVRWAWICAYLGLLGAGLYGARALVISEWLLPGRS